MLFDERLLTSRSRTGVSRSGQPLVRARVQGQDTLLLVDTGATETLFTRSLLNRSRVAMEPAEAGRDHAGADTPTWTSLDPVSLKIGGHGFELERVAVIEAPGAFEKAGVGGVLSPQTLIEDATLELDFPLGRMSLAEGAAVGIETGRRPTDDLVPLSLACRPAPGDLANLVLVEGAFEDTGPITLMLNTGSREAEIGPGAAPGSLTSGPSRGRGLSGAPVIGPIRRGRFRVDGAVMPASNAIVRVQAEGLGGQIGMEMLSLTRLQVHKASGRLCWWIPAAWRAPR